MRAIRVPLLMPVLTGVVLLMVAVGSYQRDREDAKERWSLEVEGQAHRVEEHLFDVFHSLYQGLRTIARLPGVRAIDRHAENLDQNARRTIQEIYNNLATDVAMSEVYIVPVDLDPESIDPATGKLQEPILTFDELIVGRDADAATGDSGGEAADGAEEVEIFEYRAMRDQLARLRAICPTESTIHDLDYPALSSPEVITCDNRYYSARAPDDRDRSGIVYSVPVFGLDGTLRGCVSGVVLTHALQRCLPDSYYAVLNSTHGYLAGPLVEGVWSEHRADVEAGRAAADLAYSALQPMRVVDHDGGWRLWVGRPNDEFELSPEVIRAFTTAVVLGIVGLGLATGLALREGTTRRRREEERRRTLDLQRARDVAENLSRARSNLIAVTSQEIRTPLDGIVAFADQLLRTELGAEQRSTVEAARQSAHSLIGLLQGILDFSALDAGEVAIDRGEFDLHELLESAVQLMAPVVAARPIELVLLASDDLPERAIGDAARLRQVVSNLIGNAVKFTNQGAITVHADWFLTAERPLLCLRVTDTGTGLDAEVRQRLFEPFTQGEDVSRRFGGIGLGLAISRGLVEAMGGSIELVPAPTGGTAFAVTVPLDLPTIRSVAPRPLAGRRVLVALVRPRILAMVTGDVAALGAEVVHCGGAGAVVDLLRTAAEPFDLVMTEAGDDVPMEPVYQWLQAECPDTGMVLAAGWNEPIRRAESLPACVRELVRLPLGRAALGTALLRSLAAGHRPTVEPATVVAVVEQRPAPEIVGDEVPMVRGTTAATRPVVAPARPRILVIDAHDSSLVVTCAALRRLGFEPVEAGDAAAAVASASRIEFAAVVVDWNLAGGGAAAVVPKIRAGQPVERRESLLVIGVADHPSPAERAACLTAGVDVLLARPLGSRALAAVLQPLTAGR